MRTFLHKLSATSLALTDSGLLALRLWFGLLMAFAHGYPKFGKIDAFASGLASHGYPAPEVMAFTAALSELLGGILLAIGLLTRPAALAIVVTMAVAAFVHHADDPFQKVEFALAYGVVALGLLISGPGRFSLDARIFRPSSSTSSGT